MAPPKVIKGSEMISLLVDSGLLFRINREILHPHGLALAFNYDDNDKPVELQGIWDYRNDPDGMVFEKECLKQGLQKYSRFLYDGEGKRLEVRRERLGFVVQPLEEEIKDAG